jgi:Tfp pilus assembly protein PilP
MTIRLLASAAALAALLLSAPAAAAPDAPPAGAAAMPGGLRLRTAGADASWLLILVFRNDDRAVVVGPGVTTPVTVDLARPSAAALQDAVLEASGAPVLWMGHTALVGDRPLLDAAEASPLRGRLVKGGFKGRKVKVAFRSIRLTSLLALLADVGKMQFVLGEGVDVPLTVATGSMAWNELLDAVLVAANLSREVAGKAIRIRHRGEVEPRFAPLAERMAQARDGGEPPPRAPGRCAGPQGRHELAALRLAATLTGGAEPTALLALPGGKATALRAGDCIGPGDGVVERIEPDRLIVRQMRGQADGGEDVERVTLPLAEG